LATPIHSFLFKKSTLLSGRRSLLVVDPSFSSKQNDLHAFRSAQACISWGASHDPQHHLGANAHQWVLRTAAKTLALVWHTICSSLSLKSRSCLPLSFLFLPVSGVI
jgi:hypothetical protein